MSPSGDWIKLHRSMEHSLAMSDDWLCRLWMACLLKANWRVGYFKGEAIQPGEFAFSYRLWCESLRVSRSKLVRGLKKLESAGQVRVKAGHHFSTVTICNWSTYQNDKIESGTPAERKPTHEPYANRTQTVRKPTPIEEVKEGKKERRKEKRDADASLSSSDSAVPVKRFEKPGADELAEYCQPRGVDPVVFFDFYESKGWRIGNAAMKDWRAAVRTWEKRNREGGGNGAGTNRGSAGKSVSRVAGREGATDRRQVVVEEFEDGQLPF